MMSACRPRSNPGRARRGGKRGHRFSPSFVLASRRKACHQGGGAAGTWLRDDHAGRLEDRSRLRGNETRRSHARVTRVGWRMSASSGRGDGEAVRLPGRSCPPVLRATSQWRPLLRSCGSTAAAIRSSSFSKWSVYGSSALLRKTAESASGAPARTKIGIMSMGVSTVRVGPPARGLSMPSRSPRLVGTSCAWWRLAARLVRRGDRRRADTGLRPSKQRDRAASRITVGP